MTYVTRTCNGNVHPMKVQRAEKRFHTWLAVIEPRHYLSKLLLTAWASGFLLKPCAQAGHVISVAAAKSESSCTSADQPATRRSKRLELSWKASLVLAPVAHHVPKRRMHSFQHACPCHCTMLLPQRELPRNSLCAAKPQHHHPRPAPAHRTTHSDHG